MTKSIKYILLALSITSASGVLTYVSTPSNSISLTEKASSSLEMESPLSKLSKRFLEVKGIDASLSLNINYQDKEFKVEADNFTLYLENIENISLSFSGSLYYEESKFDIDLEYLDNTLYLSVFDVKLKSTISSIKEMLNNFGISFDESKLSLKDLMKVINDIKTESFEDGNKFILKNDVFDLYFLTDSQYNITNVNLNKIDLGGIYIDGELNCHQNVDFKNLICNPETEENKYIELISYQNVFNQIENLLNIKKAKINLSGSVLDDNEVGFSFSGNTQFDIDNKSGIGEINILEKKTDSEINHNVKIDVYGIEEMLFSYNENLKGRFTINSLNDIISLIKQLMNDEDERFTKFFNPLKEQMASTILSNIISQKDYFLLLDQKIIKELKQTDSYIKVKIGGKLFSLDNDIDVLINFNENKELDNILLSLIMNDKNINLKADLLPYDEENLHVLDENDNYLDFSDIAILLKFGLKTSKLASYHIQGTVNVKVLTFSLDMGLNFYINVDGKNVKVYAELDPIPCFIGLNSSSLSEKRKAKFIYETGFVYLQRTDEKGLIFKETKDYYKKVDEKYFAQHIDTYLLGFVLGLNDNIMKSIKTSSPSDTTPIKYENIINDFKFDKENLKWDISLNMKELSKNDSLGDLNVSISGNSDDYFENLKAEITFDVGIKINLSLNAKLVDIASTWSEDIINNYNGYLLNHKDDVVESFNEE